MFSFVKKLLFVLMMAVVILFIFQNQGTLSYPVSFKIDLFVEGFNYSSPELPVFFLLMAFFLIGLLTAGLHGVYERLARKADVRVKNRRIKILESEVRELEGRLAELPRSGIGPSDEAEVDNKEEKLKLAEKNETAKQPSVARRADVIEEEPTL